MQKYLSELHHDHKEWLAMIGFYEEDLITMRKRLEEVASKNTDRDIHSWIERFQNKFIIQDEQISQLRHDINGCEENIRKNVQDNPTASDRRKIDDHVELRDHFQT